MTKRRVFCVALALALVSGACRRHGSGESLVLDGAGATLPFPLYATWSTEFARVDPSVRVNYQPLGSGAGIRQMSDGVVDFGATDEPMSDEQIKHAAMNVVHVPMTIGAVVITYNASFGAGEGALRLTPEIIADVFRGIIVRWDDDRLRAANPGLSFPSAPITVVHRADGSGTSATFATYLSKNSSAWRKDVGAGVAPRFPVGIGARGNEGVAAYVKQTPMSIGYVELAYARQAHLPTAIVRNRAGAFVGPTLASLDRAARSALGQVPDDLRFSIVDSEDLAAYPIAAVSYVIVPRDARDRGKGEALGRFVWWALHDGQRFAAPLDYAPLPTELVRRAETVVRTLRAGGQPIALGEGH